MKILITNDDGLQAAQLLPLIRWCQKLGEVTAVVPKHEQSGKSHSINIHHAFEAKQVSLAPDVTVWAVDSSPADCVRFAVLGLHLEFDLVISGVNRGLNCGTDILYSGTVAAASEAAGLGLPALALSTAPEAYAKAIDPLDKVFAYIRRHDLLGVHGLYNINIPADAGEILITRQGGTYYSDTFSDMGEDMYQPIGYLAYVDQGDDTLDTDAIMHGFISITPLPIDRTASGVYEKLAELRPVHT